MNIDLTKRVVVVTGAGRGIGQSIAEVFAAEGASVAMLDRNAETLAAASKAIAAKGGRVEAVSCDVTDAASVAAAMNAVVKKWSRVDVLVNNAGVAPSGAVEDMDEAVWDQNFDANTKGTFLCCKAVIPHMKKGGFGRILNASSFAAITPSVAFAAYASSKAAVASFTRVLAAELGPWNITVNAYAPGMIPTELNGFTKLPADRQERLLNTLALRRWGDAKDVAWLLVFLASDFAGYITGAHIDISGGKLAVQIPQAAYERAAQLGKS
ncbi:MAG TPA: SDR family NAD(P)-dependent oxidoreductase [Gemmatimonadales bacterium]|jgi:3-oxoacyl-[acyl-carrier protein] reductase